MDRRDSIKSMVALMVAPAIIKVEMLMPVKPLLILRSAKPMLMQHYGIKPMNQIAMLQIVQDYYNIERSFIIKKLSNKFLGEPNK